MRALEESAAIARRVQATSPHDLRSRYEEKERALARQADVLRRILLRGGTTPRVGEGDSSTARNSGAAAGAVTPS